MSWTTVPFTGLCTGRMPWRWGGGLGKGPWGGALAGVPMGVSFCSFRPSGSQPVGTQDPSLPSPRPTGTLTCIAPVLCSPSLGADWTTPSLGTRQRTSAYSGPMHLLPLTASHGRLKQPGIAHSTFLPA